MFIGISYSELSTLSGYQHRFGAEWRVEYEKYIGPVSKAHTRIGLSVLGIVSIVGCSLWLYRALRTNPGRGRRRDKRQRTRPISTAERDARYKRRVLEGVFFGLFGIFMGILLTLFDWGLFRDQEDEMSLAIFIAIAGYCSVIYGCRYWLKLKAWNKAVLIIGLLPFCILFTSFVRLIFIAEPMLLPSMMAVMPFLLVTVVWSLPNQSGTPIRRFSWRDFGRPKDH